MKTVTAGVVKTSATRLIYCCLDIYWPYMCSQERCCLLLACFADQWSVMKATLTLTNYNTGTDRLGKNVLLAVRIPPSMPMEKAINLSLLRFLLMPLIKQQSKQEAHL